jgi:pimeloyl-ACP methyl ester carboxylesterase
MPNSKLSYGTSTNGIPYLRFGCGPKTLLLLAGGPGNVVPRGFGALGFTRGMQAFTPEYTIYLVTRKCHLPKGYSTQAMAGDYAEMIRQDFGGHVEVVVGASYGGLIAQHLAADYADLFGHLVIAMSAHRISEAAQHIDARYAELISQRRDREAMALRAEAVLPQGVLRSVMAAMLWTFGPVLLGPVDDTFRKDVVVEAQAELAHDALASLARIKIPVLLVGSDEDFAFPLSYMQEMAGLIEKATLKIYPGGHTAAFLDKRFVGDVREFTQHDSSP